VFGLFENIYIYIYIYIYDTVELVWFVENIYNILYIWKKRGNLAGKQQTQTKQTKTNKQTNKNKQTKQNK
jgi:hypothetical protein